MLAEDGGSLSSQEGLEDGDVAVRLLSPAAEAPVDEDFEADFAALMEAHQVNAYHPAVSVVRYAPETCQCLLSEAAADGLRLKLRTGDDSIGPHCDLLNHHCLLAGQAIYSAAAATCESAYGGSYEATHAAKARASAADGFQGLHRLPSLLQG